MNVGSLKLVYFSPTGTTRKVIENIAAGIKADATEHLDLTTPDKAATVDSDINAGPAIIGAPVYGGRIPLEAVQRFRNIRALDVPAVLVVVYGNRAYEDALLELFDLSAELGFRAIAGGAFIGEHSLSIVDMPIAQGRPDAVDVNQAREFGKNIRELLSSIDSLNDLPPLQVPGNSPYKERREPLNIAPLTDEELCTYCRDCVSVCPTGSITVNSTVQTNPATCIRCCACIKVCPDGARYFEDPGIKQTRERLHRDYGERKEAELYLCSTIQ